MGGEIIDEFCGLRSKMYSILNINGANKKTANGIPGQVKNDQISHEDYRNSLLYQQVRYHLASKIIKRITASTQLSLLSAPSTLITTSGGLQLVKVILRAIRTDTTKLQI